MPNTSQPKKQERDILSISITDETREKLERICQELDRSKSWVISKLILNTDAFGTSTLPTLPPSVIEEFCEANLIITGDIADFVPTKRLFNIFSQQNQDAYRKTIHYNFFISIKAMYPAISTGDKLIDGYTTLVFYGCKLKEAANA